MISLKYVCFRLHEILKWGNVGRIFNHNRLDLDRETKNSVRNLKLVKKNRVRGKKIRHGLVT